MIKLVSEVLTELRVIDPGQQLRCNVVLTQGTNFVTFVVEAFVDATRFYHIKASESERLEQTFRAHEAAWQTFRDVVPKPLGYRVRDGWEVAVSEGVFATRLTPNDFEEPDSRTFRMIADYFVRSKQHATVLRPTVSHSKALLKPPVRTAEAMPSWRDESTLQEIDRLPHVRQHGDFVLANLGEAGGNLVVFDWEDFGKVELPGFDLCTLLVSAVDFDHKKLGSLISGRSTSPLTLLIEQTCEAMGMSPRLFRRLIPAYLELFLAMKASYGFVVQERVRGLLVALLNCDTPLLSARSAVPSD